MSTTRIRDWNRRIGTTALGLALGAVAGVSIGWHDVGGPIARFRDWCLGGSILLVVPFAFSAWIALLKGRPLVAQCLLLGTVAFVLAIASVEPAVARGVTRYRFTRLVQATEDLCSRVERFAGERSRLPDPNEFAALSVGADLGGQTIAYQPRIAGSFELAFDDFGGCCHGTHVLESSAHRWTIRFPEVD